MSAQDPVKTAARTLDLFEAFAKAKNPLSLTELAQRIGSPISSCHALVRTLQQRGYVYILDDRKRVYPTKRLLAMAQAIARHDPVLERVMPILSRLSRSTGETVILGKRQADYVTYLEVIEGNQTIRYAASPGDTKPLHSSAIGKAMLGVIDEAARERLLRKLDLARVTERTITSVDALQQDLATSRARGYFITRGENVPDVMAISIARKVADDPYGIAIAGPIGRIEARFDELVTALGDAAAGLERMDTEFRGAA
jgi:IclR family transcriptional regulator, acetate operon repressor